MALTKGNEADLLALQSVASNSAVVGSAIDVEAAYAATIRVLMGRATSSAFTVAPDIRVEASRLTAPGPDDWDHLRSFVPEVGASIGSQAVSGTEAAGQTVVTLAAGTNFAAGDYVFFHNTTIGNSEWSRVVSVSSADLTLEEAIVNAQTGATCRDQARQWSGEFSMIGYKRLRLVVNGAGSGQAVVVWATYNLITGL